MEWIKGSNYHINSKCGLYKVSKCWTGDRYRYTAWRIENQWRAVDLGVFDDPHDAKNACEADKEGKQYENGKSKQG